MDDRIIAVVVVNLIMVVCFWTTYFGSFDVMLSDDIEVNAGKKVLRKVRKKYKGFWKKFLFLDFRKKIDKWHYFLFICFLVSSFVTIIFINLLLIFDREIFRIMMLVSIIPYFISSTIATFNRWNLYKWNTVRRRPPKRKKK